MKPADAVVCSCSHQLSLLRRPVPVVTHGDDCRGSIAVNAGPRSESSMRVPSAPLQHPVRTPPHPSQNAEMANYIQGLTPVSKFWLAVGGAAVGYAYYRRNQVLADPRSHYQFYERDLDYTTKNGPRYSLGYGETGREPTGAPSASGVSQNLKVKEQVQRSIETGQPTQSGAVVSRKPVAPQQQQQQEVGAAYRCYLRS